MTFDLAQMIADREAGTPGLWLDELDDDTMDIRIHSKDSLICVAGNVWAKENSPGAIEADARRIARVPATEAEIIRLTARVAELEGALKPLADMAERYDPDEGDDGNLECWSGLAVPKIHHLRTARAALSTPTEEPKT